MKVGGGSVRGIARRRDTSRHTLYYADAVRQLRYQQITPLGLALRANTSSADNRAVTVWTSTFSPSTRPIVELVDLPSPYKTRSGTVPHLRLIPTE
jgi:hypothetical protein